MNSAKETEVKKLGRYMKRISNFLKTKENVKKRYKACPA